MIKKFMITDDLEIMCNLKEINQVNSMVVVTGTVNITDSIFGSMDFEASIDEDLIANVLYPSTSYNYNISDVYVDITHKPSNLPFLSRLETYWPAVSRYIKIYAVTVATLDKYGNNTIIMDHKKMTDFVYPTNTYGRLVSYFCAKYRPYIMDTLHPLNICNYSMFNKDFKVLVITHRDNDGMMCDMSVRLGFSNVTTITWDYGEGYHVLNEILAQNIDKYDAIFITDISVKKNDAESGQARFISLFENNDNLFWIDHHEDSYSDLSRKSEGRQCILSSNEKAIDLSILFYNDINAIVDRIENGDLPVVYRPEKLSGAMVTYMIINLIYKTMNFELPSYSDKPRFTMFMETLIDLGEYDTFTFNDMRVPALNKKFNDLRNKYGDSLAQKMIVNEISVIQAPDAGYEEKLEEIFTYFRLLVHNTEFFNSIPEDILDATKSIHYNGAVKNRILFFNYAEMEERFNCDFKSYASVLAHLINNGDYEEFASITVVCWVNPDTSYSFRTTGKKECDQPYANEIAAYFGGGGHKYAAGTTALK